MILADYKDRLSEHTPSPNISTLYHKSSHTTKRYSDADISIGLLFLAKATIPACFLSNNFSGEFSMPLSSWFLYALLETLRKTCLYRYSWSLGNGLNRNLVFTFYIIWIDWYVYYISNNQLPVFPCALLNSTIFLNIFTFAVLDTFDPEPFEIATIRPFVYSLSLRSIK